jgi:hypothetical protein
MKDWIPQIVIGLIVTVVGTILANALVGGSGHGGRHFLPGAHFMASSRPGR